MCCIMRIYWICGGFRAWYYVHPRNLALDVWEGMGSGSGIWLARNSGSNRKTELHDERYYVLCMPLIKVSDMESTSLSVPVGLTTCNLTSDLVPIHVSFRRFSLQGKSWIDCPLRMKDLNCHNPASDFHFMTWELWIQSVISRRFSVEGEGQTISWDDGH